MDRQEGVHWMLSHLTTTGSAIKCGAWAFKCCCHPCPTLSSHPFSLPHIMGANYYIPFSLLLMDSFSQSDDSLQASLAELDQSEPSEGISSGQEQDSSQEDPQERYEQARGKGERAQKEEREEEKRDYYAEHLAPDQQVDSSPPFIVVVQGSPESGKTSVIRSLVKHYTKHKVDEITGTITLRSNKKQRISIVECPNDLTAMIDLSKIADLVLLIIDASLTFEMETFQFLSLLKCHGFPSLLGVLTHLDFFKENKQLKKAKKKFKKRFEYEVGGKSKLFHLDKWDKGLYPTLQIAKLARYIGNSKPPLIPWRNNHPYILADRWQTFKDSNYLPSDHVEVSFYGYVRGGSYRVNGKMHVVGLGDLNISNIEVLQDPCPEFRKDELQEEEPKIGDVMRDEEEELEKNDEKDIGAVVAAKRRKKRTLSQNQRIIYAPSCNLGTLNFDYSSGYVTIPHDYVKFSKVEEIEEGRVEEGVELVRRLQVGQFSIDRGLEDGQEEVQLVEGLKLKSEKEGEAKGEHRQFLKKKAEVRNEQQKVEARQLVNPFESGFERKTDLFELIYNSKQSNRVKDNCKFIPEGNYSSNLKELFVTDMVSDALQQDQVDSSEEGKRLQQINKIMNQTTVKASISEETNFYRKGLYVKVTLENITFGTVKNMKAGVPVILTRNNLGEDNKGFLKARFKRHRWYSNLLKSSDPIIVSCGWRRYQSLMVFATEDQNDRLRFLKYTPQHDFCTAVYYGNFCIQDTGVVFFQSLKNQLKKFRIAGSGVVLEMNKSFDILKKIKLIGEPYKIMKHTAFVRNMFNSSIEVSSYLGAQIRTVSGIRGQIKKPLREGGQGTFRATFQDKISMSDLVFCRTWYKIVLDRFYNPILSFDKQLLMKTKYELRTQRNIEPEKVPDSEYKTIDRVPKVHAPMTVPRKLEQKLPFETAEKVRLPRKKQIERKERESIPKLLQNDKEREVAGLIQRLNAIKHMKEDKKEKQFQEKERLREARERPRMEYYDKLKKKQKSDKMASLSRKKQKTSAGKNYD